MFVALEALFTITESHPAYEGRGKYRKYLTIIYYPFSRGFSGITHNTGWENFSRLLMAHFTASYEVMCNDAPKVSVNLRQTTTLGRGLLPLLFTNSVWVSSLTSHRI